MQGCPSIGVKNGSCWAKGVWGNLNLNTIGTAPYDVERNVAGKGVSRVKQIKGSKNKKKKTPPPKTNQPKTKNTTNTNQKTHNNKKKKKTHTHLTLPKSSEGERGGQVGGVVGLTKAWQKEGEKSHAQLERPPSKQLRNKTSKRKIQAMGKVKRTCTLFANPRTGRREKKKNESRPLPPSEDHCPRKRIFYQKNRLLNEKGKHMGSMTTTQNHTREEVK